MLFPETRIAFARLRKTIWSLVATIADRQEVRADFDTMVLEMKKRGKNTTDLERNFKEAGQ